VITMPVPGFGKFERFFRAAAGVDVDKNDVRRCEDFVNSKAYDLLLIAQGTAKSNGRDIIETRDLPVTKGLQEAVHGFVKLDEETGLLPILDYLAARPPLDLVLSEETQSRLPVIAGGVTYALAQLFTIINPRQRHPQPSEWERAFRIFGLLL
jgi:hypothetical protein